MMLILSDSEVKYHHVMWKPKSPLSTYLPFYLGMLAPDFFSPWSYMVVKQYWDSPGKATCIWGWVSQSPYQLLYTMEGIVSAPQVGTNSYKSLNSHYIHRGRIAMLFYIQESIFHTFQDLLMSLERGNWWASQCLLVPKGLLCGQLTGSSHSMDQH